MLYASSLYAKKGTAQKRAWYVEKYNLRNSSLAPCASALAKQLDAGDIAFYRDDRLSRVKAATVRRDLVLLQSIIKTATIEWGFAFRPDLTRNICKPKETNQRSHRHWVGSLPAWHQNPLHYCRCHRFSTRLVMTSASCA